MRRPLAVAGIVGVLMAIPAHADVGIPMISCIHPGLWLALPLVILVEWAVAVWIVRWRAWTAAKVSFLCNIASTLLGIPLKWLLVLGLTPLTSSFSSAVQHSLNGTDAWTRGTVLQKFAIAIVERPGSGAWGAADGRNMRIWAYWAVLLIPFFLLSVWAERLVATRLLGKDEGKRIATWAWIGNGLSYALLAGLFRVLYANTWWWISQP